MPGSKEENKYIGPMIATDVTENHVIVQKRDSLKLQKVPLQISQPCFPRGEKRKSRFPSPDRPTKKLKKMTR